MKVILTEFVTPNPKEALAKAGAVCWKSIPNDRIWKHCYNANHWRILEFIDFTFEISECSRAFTHELYTHMIGNSKTMESQRYVDYQNGIGFVINPEFAKRPHLAEKWNKFTDIIQQWYKYFLVELSQDMSELEARQYVRDVLPNACYTKVNYKVNLRELIQMAEKRMCRRAYWEFREFMKQVKQQLIEKGYKDFADMLMPQCKRLGYCPENKEGCISPTKKEVLEGYKKWKEMNKKGE